MKNFLVKYMWTGMGGGPDFEGRLPGVFASEAEAWEEAKKFRDTLPETERGKYFFAVVFAPTEQDFAFPEWPEWPPYERLA